MKIIFKGLDKDEPLEYMLASFWKLQQDPETNLEAFAKKFPEQYHAMIERLFPDELREQINKNKENK